MATSRAPWTPPPRPPGLAPPDSGRARPVRLYWLPLTRKTPGVPERHRQGRFGTPYEGLTQTQRHEGASGGISDYPGVVAQEAPAQSSLARRAARPLAPSAGQRDIGDVAMSNGAATSSKFRMGLPGRRTLGRAQALPSARLVTVPGRKADFDIAAPWSGVAGLRCADCRALRMTVRPPGRTPIRTRGNQIPGRSIRADLLKERRYVVGPLAGFQSGAALQE